MFRIKSTRSLRSEVRQSEIEDLMNYRTQNPIKLGLIFILPALLLIQACKPESIPEIYRPSHAHAAYLYSLNQAGLGDTALARDWAEASRKCLQDVIDIRAPYKEAFYMDPQDASAVAYRFEVKRGHKTEIQVSLESVQTARIFIDLFRVEGDDPQHWVRVASADPMENRLEFEPRLTISYSVRLQPELLRGGRFTVTIRNNASLGFPIAGYDHSRIGSGFGEPRDGGRREHHGVDIFVPRHTPILAPADGYIRRAGEQSLGGRTIWLSDSKRSLNMYFAHLQEHKVASNTYVKKGDIIGTVGNTGNARTTPPHLHFGIYMSRSGPVDPVDFITAVNDTPAPIVSDQKVLGQWVRAKQPGISLTSAASRSAQIAELEQHVPMQIVAAANNHYRVGLPDGTSGYVSATGIESTESNIQSFLAEQSMALQDSPTADGIQKSLIHTGEVIDILAEFQNHWLIRVKGHGIGWLSVEALASPGGQTSQETGPLTNQR